MHYLGSHSLSCEADKLAQSGVSLFELPGADVPLVSGCAAWLYCELIPEAHNQQAYDLFIGEIKAAGLTVALLRTDTGNLNGERRTGEVCTISRAATFTLPVIRWTCRTRRCKRPESRRAESHAVAGQVYRPACRIICSEIRLTLSSRFSSGR